MKALVTTALCLGVSLAQGQETVLDDFANLAAWSVTATDDVRATLRPATGPHGPALCIDFDFGHVTGYVAARRELAIDFPARYEFTLGVRGAAPPNALQIKWVDASGANVWWAQKPEYRFPAEWQTLKLRQRQIEFAWGPTADRALRRSAAIEFVIASGSGAGRGSACFDRLTLRRLPDAAPVPPAPVRVDAATVDFGLPREFGALGVRWRAGAVAQRYAIELSDDGRQWRRVREVDGARGEVQRHYVPESEARFVRVADAGAARLEAIELHDAPSANDFFMQLAKDAPRGAYPRAYVGEQSYWTVLGVDGGAIASLLSEDGVLEPVPGVGALEPFLVVGGKVLGWADARITHTLREGSLPMPAVHWQVGELALDVEAFGAGTPGDAQAVARYRVTNRSARAQQVTLALAWRPFQANPPTQFLAHPGGASAIGTLAWQGRTLQVDGVPRLHALVAPSAVRLRPLAAGPVTAWLGDAAASGASGGTSSGAPNETASLADAAGFASGMLLYTLDLAPGAQREIGVALPVAGAPLSSTLPTMAALARVEAGVARGWRERLGRVRISGPAPVADVAATLRTALGHVLVNRSGPALQPGARAYARSWIRDGALTSSALLRLGHDDVARDFLRWFAPFQFQNGKVPCCATVRGADPVPEHDSDGEFAFAADELFRYTGDAATARALWPRVRAAVAHMETLRQSERTPANANTPDRRAYFGLLPPSISHEGYSDQPAYSYWDDFWAATGYRSAAQLAAALGHADEAQRIGAQRDEFTADLLASLTASTARHGLDVLPGAADRGDVDPTSSTVALSPGGLLGTLPDALVRSTFERYWRDFENRRDRGIDGAGKPWADYTPYEWRNVGALVRLGERGRALEAMNFFYRDRRPAGWKQWAEVVRRLEREPRFLGDMPHGWVASDQIRAVLDLFAYEHEAEHAMVLAAGVPLAWFGGPGLAIGDLRTPYGRLGWRGRLRGAGGARQAIEFDVAALRTLPPGGLWLRGPWPGGARASVDGRPAAIGSSGLRLWRTPAKVRVEFAGDR